MKKYNLAPGDFPDLEKFQYKLKDVKFSEFSSFKPEFVEDLDNCLNVEIPALMEVSVTSHVAAS